MRFDEGPAATDVGLAVLVEWMRDHSFIRPWAHVLEEKGRLPGGSNGAYDSPVDASTGCGSSLSISMQTRARSCGSIRCSKPRTTVRERRTPTSPQRIKAAPIWAISPSGLTYSSSSSINSPRRRSPSGVWPPASMNVSMRFWVSSYSSVVQKRCASS